MLSKKAALLWKISPFFSPKFTLSEGLLRGHKGAVVSVNHPTGEQEAPALDARDTQEERDCPLLLFSCSVMSDSLQLPALSQTLML